MRLRSYQSPLRMLLILLALAAGPVWSAANVALDNILISKTNGITTVQIWPACRMRYVNHSPQDAGRELRIRVSMDADCAERLEEVLSERYSPSSLRLGNVSDVLFESLNSRDTFITLRFTDTQKFAVRQHPVGWIEVDVDTTIDSASLPAAVPTPLDPEVEPEVPISSMLIARPPPQFAPQPSERVNVPPSSTGDFVVQLGVFENIHAALAGLRQTQNTHFAYATEIVVNGKTWHGLQLGFFDSESQADTVLGELHSRFPDAWIRYVTDNEAITAREQGDARNAEDGTVVAVRTKLDTEVAATAIPSLMASGRKSLLERQYDDAVAAYTQVLEAPNHDSHAEAREMLGVALERDGQTLHAIAEYEAVLNEYPEHHNTARVRERRNALALIDSQTEAVAPAVARRHADGWQINGGISHYYWRNQEQLVHDGNYLVNTSGVLGLGDVTLRRRGERFDVLARLNGAYQHNLVSFDERGDIGWVSNAFVDVIDHDLGLQGRLGRQTSRRDGVLDRFDGAALSYRWGSDITFGVSTGIPVDSPRFVSGSERFFYAASARVENLLDDKLTASVFTHQQTVDGISDRQAIGSELLYRQGPLSLIGLLDYDVSYNVLNTALLNATWLMENGWTLSARGDAGALPYLTTRNALAGQTATSIDALRQSFSEPQIRTLARNRTAQSTAASVGVSIPVGERFDVSLDVSLRQADATTASAGVAAIPDTGNQLFFNATVVGTNIFRENDLLLLSVRHDSTRTRDTASFVIDSRLPFGRAFRLSPRLGVVRHMLTNGGTTQMILSPSLRLLYRRQSLLIDLEAGGRWSNRDLPAGELDPFTPDRVEELFGGFVNLGYRWEF